MSRVERHAAEEAALSNTEEKVSEPKKKKKKGKPTPLGRFLNLLGSLIMLAVILLCLALAAPRLAGIKTFVVISGSMEPAIPVGSMVYSKEVDPKTLDLASDTKRIQDLKGNHLLLFTSYWSIDWALDHNKGLELREFGTN